MKKIYEIKYGSFAYGTADSESDLDIRGILLPTLEESLSLKEPKDFQEKSEVSQCCKATLIRVTPQDDGDARLMCSTCEKNCRAVPKDVYMYPIKRYFHLALGANPSVLEWLFVSGKGNILEMTKEGKVIRDNRLLFLSKEIYYRFRGFAYSEFTRLTKINGRTGEKRRQRILDLGYNTKSAMNIIRLMDEAIELLHTGSLTMPFENAKFLIDIKKGNFEYKEIMEFYEARKILLDEALKATKLPDKGRFEDADYLLTQIIKNQ